MSRHPETHVVLLNTRSALCLLGAVAVAALSFASTATADDATRSAIVVRADGVFTEHGLSEPLTQPTPITTFAGAPGVIWQASDTQTVISSVALSDTTNESWLAHGLNNERLSYLDTTGSGTPIYEHDVSAENPSLVAVACAEDVSLAAMLTVSGAGVVVRGYDSASAGIANWTYTFDPNFTSANVHGIDMASDGSKVVALAWDSSSTTAIAVVLDGATGSELNRQTYGAFTFGIDASDDASRIVLTEGQTAHVVETAGMTTLFSFAASGFGNVFHRISGNGLAAVAGGFLCRAYRDTGTGWTQTFFQADANQWYGTGLALSGDGQTLFCGSYDFTNSVDVTYRVIDLASGSEETRISYNGSGTLQNPVASVAISDDGQTLASATWGTMDNAVPEIQIYDRALNVIGSIDTPGSMFSIDMSGDGQFLLGAGKTIHANTTGRGSDAYAYRIGTAPTPITVCGVGAVNAGCGATENILAINGSSGGTSRTVTVTTTTALSATIDEAPVERGDTQTSLACIYAWLGVPDGGDVVVTPKGLGTMCYGPFIIATQNPVRIWNSIGAEPKLGTDNGPGPVPVIPDNGSFTLFSLPGGLGQTITATFQGIVVDSCTQGTVSYSVTNGVVVDIQ